MGGPHRDVVFRVVVSMCQPELLDMACSRATLQETSKKELCADWNPLEILD
jgi:hypothetical protein